MKKIQILLFLSWVILVILTLRACLDMNPVQAAVIFYADFTNGWRGQLNFDFQIYLILLSLWIFYREKNFFRSYIFALLALLAGNIFLLPYLIYLISHTKGDIKKILLGRHV